MFRKLLVLVPLLLLLPACITVTARKEGDVELKTKPTVVEANNFYVSGFGTNHHDVKAACKGKSASQIQFKDSIHVFFVDFTNANIWCE